MKKQSSKQPQKQSSAKIIGLTILSAVVMLLGWNWYVHYTDRQKFMTLKQDMLSLQSEFNKIDTGWKYSEGCHGKGEKFKENQISSCGLGIDTANDSIDKGKILAYRSNLEAKFKVTSQSTFTHQGYEYSEIVVKHKNYDVNCSFLIKIPIENNLKKKSLLECSGSALDFYFPKTQ